MIEFKHIPIMATEVIDLLAIKPDGIYVDCTLGGGGHAKLIVEKLSDQGKLIAIDQDEEALSAAKEYLSNYSSKISFVRDNFRNLGTILHKFKIAKVDGIFLDLGVSSYQLDNPLRGFSFREEFLDSRLDMRMDQNQNLDAFEVVNYYTPQRLAEILFRLGEEKFARQIAREIVRAREKKHLETSGDLVRVIEDATPPKYRYAQKPGQFASNTFRAIRMEVNDELGAIDKVLPQAVESLKSGGRLVVLTFQSLEDRPVKKIFKALAEEKAISPISRETTPAIVKLLTRKPLVPSDDEIDHNPRSNCAKLRAIEKI